MQTSLETVKKPCAEKKKESALLKLTVHAAMLKRIQKLAESKKMTVEETIIFYLEKGCMHPSI